MESIMNIIRRGSLAWGRKPWVRLLPKGTPTHPSYTVRSNMSYYMVDHVILTLYRKL